MNALCRKRKFARRFGRRGTIKMCFRNIAFEQLLRTIKSIGHTAQHRTFNSVTSGAGPIQKCEFVSRAGLRSIPD